MYRRERWWAAGLTLGLHTALLCWAWSEASLRLATNSVVYVEAVLLPDRRSDANAIAGESPTVHHVEPGTSTPAERPPRLKPQSTYIKPDPPSTAPEPIGYLPFDAVDQAAEPLGDWVIDTEILPPGRTVQVVLKLWISATGVIDQWSFSGVAGDDEELARRALAGLSKTLIQPAFLNHIPVSSFRQLEVVLAR